MRFASGGPRVAVAARAWGAAAVVGVVIAFSLSSTLVKRAHSPGVLVAFWRMATVSVVWNLYLRCTGRRVTMRDVRQALVPGVFFGLNLAIFFAGATHNSVANAALIGSLSPFLIVPIGAWLFNEYFDWRALVFALVVLRRCCHGLVQRPGERGRVDEGQCVRTDGDAALGLLRLVDASFRRDMDVATFMATVSPIAAVAVLPLAIANGDVFGMSSTGWTYMLILDVAHRRRWPRVDGVRPEDDPDRHDRCRPVVQPALAVVWSFLLLSETVRGWQVVGIAVAISRAGCIPRVERTWRRGLARGGTVPSHRRGRGPRRHAVLIAASDESA